MQMNVAIKVESILNGGPNDVGCGISDDFAIQQSEKSLGIAVQT